MKNLTFVLWMIGFPAISALSDHVQFMEGITFSDEVKFFSSLTWLAVWGIVGYLLYEPTKKKDSTF